VVQIDASAWKFIYLFIYFCPAHGDAHVPRLGAVELSRDLVDTTTENYPE
jgi:hypothetical protein